MTNSNKNLVSIILITWNALGYTKLCIRSILKYTSHPFRMIIVDNGSRDGTIEYLKSLKAKLILNDRNKGFAYALNQGYKAAKSNFICILNNDVVVSKNWLEALVKVYRKYPKVKAIGPIRPARFTRYPFSQEDSKSVLEKIKDKAKEISLSPQQQLELFCNGRSYDRFVEDFKKYNAFGDIVVLCPPGILSTCCALMEKNFLKTIGGVVDTRYKLYGADDADLSWRIAAAGYQLMVTSEVYIHHFEHVSADLNKLDREALLQKNGLKFFRKWRKFFWQYINKKLNAGFTLEEVSQEHWFVQRIFQLLEDKEIPQEVKTLSIKNAELKKRKARSS